MTMRHWLSFLLVFPTISSTLAFVIPSTHSAAVHNNDKVSLLLPPRSLTVLSSAKVLPIAYTGALIALLQKAIWNPFIAKAEMAVLGATSVLSCIDFGLSNNINLTSAKKATKKTSPSSAGKEKQECQAALTWRRVVSIKIIGQVLGLLWMSCNSSTKGVMFGAATIMGSILAFFLAGAGRAQHNNNGNWKPMLANESTKDMTIHAVLCNAALIAGKSTVDLTRFVVTAGIYSVGTAIGALKGIPNFFGILL